ncbi:MAG: hypothetical protein IJ849_08760 [Selenomonadaceae bacterium]|nr:hypothetical protein [Selenomonadaceae bacterium]
MMSTHKLPIVCIVFTMVALLLTGCGGSSNSNKQVANSNKEAEAQQKKLDAWDLTSYANQCRETIDGSSDAQEVNAAKKLLVVFVKHHDADDHPTNAQLSKEAQAVSDEEAEAFYQNDLAKNMVFYPNKKKAAGAKQVDVKKNNNNSRKQSDQTAALNAEKAVSAIVNGNVEMGRKYIEVDMNLNGGLDTFIGRMHSAFYRVCLKKKIQGLRQSDDTNDLIISHTTIENIDANQKNVTVTIDGDPIRVKMLNVSGEWKMSIKSYIENGV